MNTHDVSTEPEIVVKSRQAAFCARRSLGAHDLTATDMDDMIQSAALAFWKYSQRGQPVPYCFVAARDAARKCYYRQILGRGPLNTLSLDAMEQEIDENPRFPAEWLVASPPGDDTRSIDWLSDEVLEGVLYEARHAAGYSQGKLTRHWQTIQTDKQVIRLAAGGHTNASIAQIVGTTEGSIRDRRNRIRRLLKALLPPESIPEYRRTGGNAHTARAVQLTYPRARKPVQA